MNISCTINRLMSVLAVCMALLSCKGQKSDVGNSEKSPSSSAETVVDPNSRPAEVNVIDLEPSTFSHEIVSNGKISARQKCDVCLPTSGLISSIHVKNGQRVAKGQKLASLDSSALRAKLEREQTSVATARLEMQDVLIGQGYDPEHPENIPAETLKLARLRSGLQQAELAAAATRRELAETEVLAPASGFVADLKATPHSMTTGSQPLCRIIDNGLQNVEFSILESELALVKKGDVISVSPFSESSPHQGRIVEINPTVDANGMVKVWGEIQNAGSLIDGMNVRVCIKRAVERALVVPKSAVVLRSGRQVVFTFAGGKAMWNYVTTGLENLSEYTVTEGLEPGMKVITGGNINLAHESPVRVMK